jgi:hypothetical protein
MNRTPRGFGLLLLISTAACVAQVDPLPAAQSPTQESPEREIARAAEVAYLPAPVRTPLSAKIRDQLATRGIKTNAGPELTRAAAPKASPQRTTVEQEWIVQGHTMQRVETNNPTNIPHRYAVQLTLRIPLQIKGLNQIIFDPKRPGMADHCSGTLIGDTAVLTAGHCYIQYTPVAVDPNTMAIKYSKVWMYSIDASPRRNGSDFPFGTIPVKRTFFDTVHWPGSVPEDNPLDYDYAVVRLKKPVFPTIPVASHRVIATPTNKTIETAEYPMQVSRGFRMYYSLGDLGGLISSFVHSYETNVSAETDSSGAGVFEAGVDGVAGLIVGETNIPGLSDHRVPDQMVGPLGVAGPRPNNVLMLSSISDGDIGVWINAPL